MLAGAGLALIGLVWQLLRRQWRAVAWTIGTGLVLGSTLLGLGLDESVANLALWPALPFVALAGMWLPFLARDPRPQW